MRDPKLLRACAIWNFQHAENAACREEGMRLWAQGVSLWREAALIDPKTPDLFQGGKPC